MSISDKYLDFFVYCSGVDRSILEKCPVWEHRKYAGLGSIVLFTGLVASILSAYALYTVFDIVWLSVMLGILWGSMIFSLDRLLVSTMKNGPGKLGKVVKISPRLLLAVVMSLVLSTPILLKIFEEEILENIYYTETMKADRLDSLYQERITSEQGRIDGLMQKTAVKLEFRDKYYEDYICECDGTCGTGEKGRGTECERKEQKYLKSDREYQITKKQNDEEIEFIKAQMIRIREMHFEELKQLQASFADGLLARIEALRSLPITPRMAIIFLIFFVEIAPIQMRFFLSPGTYEHLKRTVEYNFEIDEIKTRNKRDQLPGK